MSLQQIQNIISDQTGLNKELIQFDTAIEELQIDDLDLADIYIALEDLFDVSITEDEIETFETIGDVLEFIEEHVEIEDDDDDL